MSEQSPPGVETVHDGDQVLAIIVRASYEADGINFFSPGDFALQLGHMRRPAGYRIAPHVHHPVQRNTVGTQEVLFIRKGVVRASFYSENQELVDTRVVSEGDILLLAAGGHGFDVLEEATIVEVKNGPYLEGADKGRFAPASPTAH